MYVGTTANVAKRIQEHNEGLYLSSLTVKGIPWILKLSFECQSSKKAHQLERFKKKKCKVFIEKIIADKNILKDISRRM